MKTNAQQGFTLYELLVTLVVMGVLFGIGIPNLIGMIRDNRMAASANDIVSMIYAARSHAVKEQRLVTLCASANPTAATPTCSAAAGTNDRGFVVFVDDDDGDGIDPTDGNIAIDPGETILIQRAAAGGTLNLFANSNSFISYAPNGFVGPGPGGVPSTTTILLCDERGNRDVGGRSAARVINISVIGRPQMLTDVADVTAAAAANVWTC